MKSADWTEQIDNSLLNRGQIMPAQWQADSEMIPAKRLAALAFVRIQADRRALRTFAKAGRQPLKMRAAPAVCVFFVIGLPGGF